MLRGELMDMLVRYAKEYSKRGVNESVHRNNHMNRIMITDVIDARVSDAIIVDFVNFIGTQQGIDLALYTGDLHGSGDSLQP